MKKRVFRTLAVLAVLAWMLLIFGFSAQSGEESGGLSAIVAKPIASLIAAWKQTEVTDELYQQVDNAVRTAAHFGEYAILGGLLLVLLQHFGQTIRWLPWLIGTAYAVLDEWHQAYTPGRFSDPADVLIDTFGVLCGVQLTHCLIKIWRKKHVHYS